MDRGIFVALSGGIAEDRRLTTLTNNLANANTVGFKKDKPVFKMVEPSAGSQGFIDYRDISASASLPIKTFVEQQGTATDISQGEIKKTGNPLDAAISGDGFFKVSTPNGDRYTRQGSFTLDSEGRLMTKDGYSVMGEGGVITLTPGKVEIASDGTISVDGNTIDKLNVVAFSSPDAIEKDSDGLFKMANANANETTPEGAAVVQGHIESSNVSVVKEMTAMIEVLRAYESQMKLIQTFDELTQKANDMGRV